MSYDRGKYRRVDRRVSIMGRTSAVLLVGWLGVGWAGVGLVGCSAGLNRGLALGDSTRPSQSWVAPSIGPSEQVAGESAGKSASWSGSTPQLATAGRDIDEPDARTLHGLDRSEWEQTRVLVPNDAIEHRPRYTKNVHLNFSDPRARGEFPTASSALNSPTRAGLESQVLEAVVAPLAAGADLALVPVRMIRNGPLDTTRSGQQPYARVPKRLRVFDAGRLEGVGLLPVEPLTKGEEKTRESAPPSVRPQERAKPAASRGTE